MQVTLKPSVHKSLKKLPKDVRTKFKQTIDQLFDTATTAEIRNEGKLKGYTNRYKIRIGNYRMIYKIESKNHITITAIAHRKNVYDRLFGFTLSL